MVEQQAVTTVGAQYASNLLADWLDCHDCSIQFREYLLSENAGSAEAKMIMREYISRLTRLWLELWPKIKDRTETTDFKDFAKEYEAMKRYYYAPEQLVKSENAEDIFKLEELIRIAIEKLRLTVW